MENMKIKWDISLHDRDLCLLKPTQGQTKKFKHLTRAHEVAITWFRIGHTKAIKSHILSWGPPTTCQHCGQTLTIEQMLLDCAVLQQSRDKYYTTDSPSLRRFAKLAKWSFWEKLDCFIWYEWSYIQYNSLLESVTTWRNFGFELIPTNR